VAQSGTKEHKTGQSGTKKTKKPKTAQSSPQLGPTFSQRTQIDRWIPQRFNGTDSGCSNLPFYEFSRKSRTKSQKLQKR
jgi:hypothetical protein